MENKVMSAIYKDRDSFERIRPLVEASSESIFSDVDAILYDRAVEYYDMDKEAESIDRDVIMSYIQREYPSHEDILSIALDRIEATTPISCNNVVGEFLQVKRHSLGHKLAGELLSGKRCDDTLEEFLLLRQGEHLETGEDIVIHSCIRASDLAQALDRTATIEIYPKDLNDRVEGLMRGDHLLVFARPETGKSLFTINLTRGFLEQGLVVLYVGNEDSERRMLPRFVGSILNMTKVEMEAMSFEDLDDLLDNSPIDNFHFVHLEPGTFPQIRGLIHKITPDILIVDQIRNVLTGGDGLTIGLERASTEMRNIANEFDIVCVSVTQAGESGSGKLRLDLSDVDSSKTGLQAQVDVMVGIGVNEDYEGRGKRMLSLPKNKCSGDHSFFSIDVDTTKNRIL